MKEIILASNSPRRREILQQAGIRFKIQTSECDEIYSVRFDEEIVKQNSLKKASALLNKNVKNALIIGADTIVILNSVCLVKPHSFYEGFFMLKKLSNKTHQVITSHTIIDSDTKKTITETSTSNVTFKKLSNFEILKYLITKNPLDKAGCYGIQDFIDENQTKGGFIEKLDGSFYNVMGLDIDVIQKMLSNF